MNSKQSQLDNEKESFRRWLVTECKMSKKAASDCISRCQRVETATGRHLSQYVATEADYHKLMIDIHTYAMGKAKNTKSAYTLTGTLRSACKKYALFKNPSAARTFKSAHGLTRYR